VLDEDCPSFAGYEEEAELGTSGLRSPPVDELIELLEAERSQMAILGRVLVAEDAGRTGVHLEVGGVTVVELLHQATFHATLYLVQVASLLSLTFEGRRGSLSSASS